MECYDSQRRIIHNHQELKNTLKQKYGNEFLIIALDNLNIIEQFDLFYNSKIIIEQHCAELTNIFFCKKNVKIIKITPKYNDNNNWFKNLSHFLGYNYVNINKPSLTKEEWNTYNIKSENNKLLQSFIENSGSICKNEVIKNI